MKRAVRMQPIGGEAGTSRTRASERIRRAAIALFRARGYHGTPVRALARIVRVESASLYYHFPSKQELLRDIFTRIMDDLLAGLQKAIAAGTSAEDRLQRAVRFHVRFHIERQAEAAVSRSELRSLTLSNLRPVIAKRDRYEGMLRTLLQHGVDAGAFDVRDVQLTTIAILTMCSSVSDWFSGRGRLSADEVADAYAGMVQQLVGRDGAMRVVRSRVAAPTRAGSGRASGRRGSS